LNHFHGFAKIISNPANSPLAACLELFYKLRQRAYQLGRLLQLLDQRLDIQRILLRRLHITQIRISIKSRFEFLRVELPILVKDTLD